MNKNMTANTGDNRHGVISANMPEFYLREPVSSKIHHTISNSAQASSNPSTHNPAINKLTKAKRLLMLQGPIGPMFDRVADWKLAQGAAVHRIVFNAGDALFCKTLQANKFIGATSDWPKYLRLFIEENGIDAVLLFGQSRQYHASAATLCRAMGISLLVMEEGYIRPGFITLELDGVNGHSSTLKKFHLLQGDNKRNIPIPAISKNQFFMATLYAIAYYTALIVSKKQFPLYQHHRDTHPISYIAHWLKSALKKFTSAITKSTYKNIFEESSSYFFIPLQLDSDAQVINHSDFDCCIHFLKLVMQSFAENTSESTLLVIKQHPMARGEKNSEQFAKNFAKKLGLEKRIVFLYEGHIPTLIKHAIGTVTINSTVGLQAIYQNKPLKVLGNAIYENDLVTDAKPLHQFWQSPMQPDARAAKHLHDSIKVLTQAPAAIYAARSVPLTWSDKRSVSANT